MHNTRLDAALIATYEAFDVPVDQFIGNQELAEAFSAFFSNCAGDPGLGAEGLIRRLVYLRKRSRLPRLRRSYYGRNPSNN